MSEPVADGAGRRARVRLRLGARSQLAGLDRRTLGFGDVVAQSVAVMAPCAAAATIPMLVSQSGGPLVWSVIGAAVLSALVAVTLGAFASRMAAPGALYTYVAKGLGSTSGLITAAAMVLGYGALGVLMLSQMSWYGLRLIGVDDPGPAQICVAATALAVLCAVLLIRGIRFSARVGLVVESVAVVVLLAVVVALLVRTSPHSSLSAMVAGPDRMTDLFSGVAIAVCGLVGFESAATLSVEARRPLRTVPRAMRVSLGIGVVVVVLATAAQAGNPSVLEAIAGLGSGDLGVLTRELGVGWVTPIVYIGVCASILACMLASTTALTRTLLSLSREGVVPAPLGRTHPRYKTPVVGVVVSVALIAAVVVVSIFAGASANSVRGSMASAPAIAFLVAYALVCVAAPVFLYRTGELQPRIVVAAALGSVGIVTILVVFIVTNIGGAWWPGILAAVAWLVIAALGCVVLRVVRPELLARVGIHETPTRSEVWSGHLDTDDIAVVGPTR